MHFHLKLIILHGSFGVLLDTLSLISELFDMVIQDQPLLPLDLKFFGEEDQVVDACLYVALNGAAVMARADLECFNEVWVSI